VADLDEWAAVVFGDEDVDEALCVLDVVDVGVCFEEALDLGVA
jgi:hypothetical protein